MSKLTRHTVILCHLALATSLLVLLAAVAYCWRNDAGHSGIAPIFGIYFFAPVFALGIIGLILTKGRYLSPRALVATAIVGMTFGFFVTKLRILNPYEDWIAAGMPDRNPNTALLLVGFVLGGLGGSLAIAYLTTPSTEKEVATGLLS